MQLSDVLNDWLARTDVRPRFSWGHRGISFMNFFGTVHDDSLTTLGAVAVQLALAVSGAHSLAVCSACGRPYTRTGRRPQRGRRNYCPDCGIRTAWRDSKVDQQAGVSSYGKRGGKHGKATRTRRG